MSEQNKEKHLSFLRFSSEAQSFLHHGKKEEALACYDTYLEQFPDDTRAHYGKGMIYYEFHKLEEALACFDQALALDENDFDSLYAKGVVLNAQGRSQEAIAIFEMLLKREVNFPLAWLAKGYALLKEEKAEKALHCFLEVEKLSDKIDVATGKGHAYRMLKKLKKAKSSYSEALAKDPYDAEALFGLGVIAYSANNLKRATELLYRCVVQDESHLQAWELLADIYRKTKQEEKEQVALEHVAKLREHVSH